MKFCGSCGKQIPDDAHACPYCGTFQEDDAVPVAKPKAKSKSGKPFPTKLVVIGLVAVAVIVGAIFGAIALFGGGWEDPLEDAVEILNNKKFTADAVKDLGRCFAGDTGADALDSFVDKAFDIDIDGYDVRDLVGIDRLLDHLEDDYGKNVKFSVKIEDTDPMTNSRLKTLRDAYLKDCGKQLMDEGDRIIDMSSDDLADLADEMGIKKDDLRKLGKELKELGKQLKNTELKKGYDVDTVVTVKGSEDKDSEDTTYVVAKAGSKWILPYSVSQYTLLGYLRGIGYQYY